MLILNQYIINGNQALVPIILDDSLYQTCLSYKNVEIDANSLAELPPLIDEQFNGMSVWQYTKLPVKLPITDTTFQIIFPNLYQSDNCIPTDSAFPLSLKDGTVVPGTYINGGSRESSGIYRYTTNDSSSDPGDYNSVDFFTFPVIGMEESHDNDYTTCRIYFGILPESCLVDNKIDLTNIDIGAGAIYIRIKESDKSVFCQIQLTSDNNPPQNSTIINFWKTQEVTIYEDDPFSPGGESGTGGGGGDFDNTSTPIEIPNLPSISASSTGFISLFNPSLSQLNELSAYLWSDLFEIDGWKKLFADPMDAILGLSILPVAVPSGGTREVKVGNIGTGISLTVAASQFVEVDCGSIDVNEYWGAYLDYEPYTQAQIFLPYIGTRPISVDEIMGKTVRVIYHVDILTGACCCFVKCGDSVLYTYNGQCSIPIPITGANYSSVVNGVISVAASVGSLVATGGASAPTAIPAIASSAINQMKPSIEKSGSISGSAGVLNMQIPYLILIRPRQALPSKQNEFIGYPSLITVQLTELSGYTEVQSIHLENISATQEELSEIQSLLEGGVIF